MTAEAEIKEAEAAKIKKEKALKEARAERAKEVETALKVANQAQAEAIKKLKSFIHDYGYFHTSYTLEDVKDKNENRDSFLSDFRDLVDVFLN